ncbi:MAG: hypothetical protein AB7P00_05055 [Sandaracinaceae bacterium]
MGVRGPRFGIQLLRSNRIVTDWGLQASLVRYIARQTRTQVSIVLEGTGYFELDGGRFVTLRPGDVVISEQARQGAEGYAGQPSAVLIVDWAEDVLRGAHRGPPSIGALGGGSFARVFAACEAAEDIHATNTVAADEWGRGMLETLRAAGLIDVSTAWIRHESLTGAPSAASEVFAALGDVRASLHEHPSLAQVAERTEISERHLRRAFDAMNEELETGIGGWRDALGDLRIAMSQQLLSVPELPLATVAKRSGFRSAVALCHAFAERGGGTPRMLARAIRERWELRSDLRHWDEAAE